MCSSQVGLEPPIHGRRKVLQARVMDAPLNTGWTIEGEGNQVQFTLVKLLYSIVNPCYPIFSIWVLSECMIFVIYPELPQLQNGSEERCIHCLCKAVSQHYCCRDPSANCMIFWLLFQKHHLYRCPPFLTIWCCILCDEVKQWFAICDHQSWMFPFQGSSWFMPCKVGPFYVSPHTPNPSKFI